MELVQIKFLTILRRDAVIMGHDYSHPIDDYVAGITV